MTRYLLERDRSRSSADGQAELSWTAPTTSRGNVRGLLAYHNDGPYWALPPGWTRNMTVPVVVYPDKARSSLTGRRGRPAPSAGKLIQVDPLASRH